MKINKKTTLYAIKKIKMKDLKISINKITKWGISISEDIKMNNAETLSKQLLELSYLFSKLNFQEFNNNEEYPEPPEFKYDEIRKLVSKNFPDFGFYNSILNIIENIGVPEFGVGDAIDDLTDLIKDFLEIKWYFEN